MINTIRNLAIFRLHYGVVIMAEQLRLNIIDNEIKAYLDQLTESHED